MAKGGRKRSKFQREQDLVKTEEMYLDGRTQLQIAQTLGVSQTQISNDLQFIMQKWKEARTDMLDRAMGEELAKLNRDEQRFTQLWLDSLNYPMVQKQRMFSGKAKTKTVGSKQVIDDDNSPPDYFRVSTTEDGSRGNPFYWEQIKWCRAERARLLGLYSPLKIAKTSPDGQKEALGGELDFKEDFIDMLLEQADKRILEHKAAENEKPINLLEAASVDGELLENSTEDDSPADYIDVESRNVPPKPTDDILSEAADLHAQSEVDEPVDEETKLREDLEDMIIRQKVVTEESRKEDEEPEPPPKDAFDDTHFKVPIASTLIKKEKIDRYKEQAAAPYRQEKPAPPVVKGVVQDSLGYRRSTDVEGAEQVEEYVEGASGIPDDDPLSAFIRSKKRR